MSINVKLNFLCSIELCHKGHKKCNFPVILSVFSAKMGINYPDLEPGNKFWSWVQVPGFCYKSLIYIN